MCGHCDHFFVSSYFPLDSLQHTGIPLPHWTWYDSVNQKVETEVKNAESVEDCNHHGVHSDHALRVKGHQEEGDGNIQGEGETEDGIGTHTDQLHPCQSFLSNVYLSPER